MAIHVAFDQEELQDALASAVSGDVVEMVCPMHLDAGFLVPSGVKVRSRGMDEMPPTNCERSLAAYTELADQMRELGRMLMPWSVLDWLATTLGRMLPPRN